MKFKETVRQSTVLAIIPTDNPSTHTILHVTVIEVYYDRGEQIPDLRSPWPLSSLQWRLTFVA